MSRRPLALSLAITVLVTGAARAQVVGTLGAGTGQVTYDDAPRSTVVSLNPAVVFEGERTTVSAAGSLTRFEGGVWSAQAIAAGSRFSMAHGPFRSEMSAQLETNSHRSAFRTTQVLAQGRGHLLGGSAGLWLGAGGGHAWRSPTGGALYRADVGAWAQLAGATIRLTAAQNVVNTSESTAGVAMSTLEAGVATSRNTVVLKQKVQYLDADAHVAWSNARIALDAAAGQRATRDGARTNTWLLGGSVMLTDRLALVGATGATAYDIAQRLPGGRYATISLRVTTRAGRALELGARTRAVARDMETWREQDGTVLLVVHAPRARRVEVMGDFTDWRPLVMRREADDHFAARIHLPAGSYRINVRVDGGAWTAPPGTTPLADEYNGAAGLLVIGA